MAGLETRPVLSAEHCPEKLQISGADHGGARHVWGDMSPSLSGCPQQPCIVIHADVSIFVRLSRSTLSLFASSSNGR